MTVYTKSMMESLAEVRDLQLEDNMDLMRKAAGGSAQNVKMKDGKLKMDAFTASAIMKVYDKVNPANKKKIETIINSGKKNQMMKLQSMAMKAIKSDYDAELDEAVKRGTLKDLENLEKSLRDAKKKKDKKKADALQKELEALMKSGLGKKIGPDWMHKEEAELDEMKSKSYALAVKGKIVAVGSKADMMKLKKQKGGEVHMSPGAKVGDMVEEVETTEAYEVGTDEYRKYTQDITPGEPDTVDEASARADAMRAMRRGKKDVDPADVDDTATDADIKAASKNIMMQMRKVVSLGGKFDVEFLDKKKVKVKPAIANKFIQKYQSMRRPADKEKFQNQAAKSYKDLLQVLKSQYMAAACNGGSTASSGRSAIGMEYTPEETELDEALEQYVVIAGPGDNNQKILDIFKGAGSALKKAKKVRDDWNKKNKSKIKLNKKGKPIAAHMARIAKLASTASLDGVPIKKGDDISWSQFNQRIVKEEVELDEALPSHLQKFFDKDGNPKSKEGKAAWERIAKAKGFKKYTDKQIKMAIGVAFDKRYVQGNMTGAAKTIEKIAKGLSNIEPVRDALRRANEEVVKEGTWAVPQTPKQKSALKKLLSKPLKAKDAEDKLYDIIGDDDLFDDIGDFASKEPNADVRPMVKTAMKRLGIKENTILDRIDAKLRERKNG